MSEPVEADLSGTNGEIIRRRYAVLNTGDVPAAALYYSEDTHNHGRPVGRQGVQRTLADIRATFPDWHVRIDDLAEADDAVIIRTTVTATHTGISRLPVLGGLLVGVQPTGRSIKVQHIHWQTLRAGRIVEHRANRDDIGMMQQLGLLPISPGAALASLDRASDRRARPT